MNITFWYSLGVFLASLALFVEIALGSRKLKSLTAIEPFLADEWPKVSIIITALNEADTIEPALRSLLSVSYPNLEIIAINDRSTDDTPLILEKVHRMHPVLRVIHIRDLPSGWLGKNHALYQGAKAADGDYLLFSDADVVFEPSAVARAVAYCEKERLDHLTIFPEAPADDKLFAMLLLRFRLGLFAKFKPWKVRTSRKHFIGVGAFNMVRRSVYWKMGGHEAISLAVLDDLMIGKRINAKGFSQDVLVGVGLLTVAWYRTTAEMFKGLQKNVFAAFDYRLSKLFCMSILFFSATFWPWVALFFTEGPTRWINCATIIAEIVFYLDFMRTDRWSRWCLVYLPVSSILSIAMWWQGSVLALMRGNIEWRGTKYPLSLLKQAHDD